MRQRNVKKLTALWLCVMLSCLAACATPMQPSVQPSATLPLQPSLTQPEPSVPYLEYVATTLKQWDERLQAILSTLKN